MRRLPQGAYFPEFRIRAIFSPSLYEGRIRLSTKLKTPAGIDAASGRPDPNTSIPGLVPRGLLLDVFGLPGDPVPYR